MTLTLQQLEALPLEHRLLALEEAELRRERGRRIYRFFPDEGKFPRRAYLKHLKFFEMGARLRQRAFMAGNRVGKTMAGLYETVLHMTGEYPAWWVGRRYRRSVRVWIAGDTSKSVREGLQVKLFGDWGDFGTGMIPADKLLRWSPKQGTPEAVDTFAVKHATGGISRGELKSYDQGRIAFQSTERDVILLDEEPADEGIYTECLTRTMTTNGIVMLTFTPLRGASAIVTRFLTKGLPIEGAINDSRGLVMAGWNDVPHLTEKDKEELKAEYPNETERKARTLGIPTLGSGLVFLVPEDDLIVEPFRVPPHWPQGCGLDFGWDHPSAATHMTWDRDKDCIYVLKDWRERNHTPAMTALALKSWDNWLPFAWPHDGLQHDKGSGEELAGQYRDNGLQMMDEKATFPDGGNGVEAGINEMHDRMKTGRWKVVSTCMYWREEYRTYHRKDGLIVKLKDDTISSSRYGYMMRRYWRTQPKPQKLRINTDWRRA